ncbi:hypothetical protein [Meridianimarinicoccus marinus]|uniref:hypothetical protein n=1 Tax=Meridianimarinicoccus marinus TaxID=3231483 RepID=UPI00344C6036
MANDPEAEPQSGIPGRLPAADRVVTVLEERIVSENLIHPVLHRAFCDWLDHH